MTKFFIITVTVVIAICLSFGYVVSNAPQCLFAEDPITCVEIYKLQK